ncbi:MAG: 4Fe-4S dicluster domain-containing protein [Eubacteriales bacterium]|nr:4Fe-4S dicluster domain-containing protein [Eubacteriales bacterium]
MQEQMISRAKALLQDGTVDRVLGWKIGEFKYDLTPAVFKSAEEIDSDFVYNTFSCANLSKYLIKETRKDGGKILIFVKPCDSYSLQQLIKEHRVNREKIYIIGIECFGKTDIEKVKDRGLSAICDITEDDTSITVETAYGEKEKIMKHEVMAERCLSCKSKKIVIFDELIGENGEVVEDCNRFDMVARLEAMTPDERFEFWQNELSRCIRCNACRNVCPACTCEKCVFDNDESGVAQKAAQTSFEESNFHIIRAFHVAGRCTDCGECTRVCPQHIPLHLLNRKFIKDANELYGEYQAGEDADSRYPMVDFTFDDCEPSVVYERGGDK